VFGGKYKGLSNAATLFREIRPVVYRNSIQQVSSFPIGFIFYGMGCIRVLVLKLPAAFDTHFFISNAVE